MRRFYLADRVRGAVAEGCLFSSGKVSIDWYGANDSSVWFSTLEKFENVSVKGHDHEGKLTRWLEWVDE